MAKGISPTLYNLIHSLSPSEQRYYKLTSKIGKSETPVLLKLFEAIENQQVYDEPQLLKTLKKSFPNANTFRVQKIRLYDSILKTMRQYHASDKNVETQLAQDIQNIRFLVKKKLFDEAKRYIKSAKKIAYRYERLFHLLALIRLEIQILSINEDLKAIATQVDVKRKEADDVLELLKAYFSIQTLDLKVKQIILAEPFTRDKKPSRLQTYQALLKNPAFSLEIQNHLFEAKIYHFILQSLHDEEKESLGKGPVWEKFRSRYEAFLQSIEKEGKAYLFKTHEGRFFALLYNLLRYANNTTLKDAVKALHVFETAVFEDENLIRNQKVISFRMALRFAYVQGDVKLFNRAMETYYVFFEKNQNKIPKAEMLTVYSYLPKCYLMFGRYSEAEKAAKKILSLGKQAPGIRTDIVDTTLLILVLIYAERNQRTNFYRSIKPVEAIIQAKQLTNSIDSEIIAFGKILVSKISTGEKRTELERHVLKLNKLASLKHNEKLLQFFEFVSWYQSKLDKNPHRKFIEITRRNNGIE